MKVILLRDIPKIGKKYDVKDVSDGYALNWLIPRGLAQVATEQAIKKVEMLRVNDVTDKRIQTELLVKNIEIIKSLKLTLKEKANEKGHLFAGVTKEILAQEILKVTRIHLDPEFIQLEKPIKEIGEHRMILMIMGKTVEFIVNIEAN